MMISIIIPFHNEKENLPILIDRLVDEFKIIKKEYEIVLVDDGSTDQKILNLKSQISNKNINLENFQVLRHNKKSGKGEALKTGVENAKGDIIVFMDADLQDDPKDLPRFIKALDDGADFVNGIRQKRQDNKLVKFYSKLAEYFLHTFLNSPFTDINCGFKAFKKKVLEGFTFYGNNFRFFPLFVYYNGYMVSEIKVINNQRIHGKSKFGPSKLVNGIFDTLTAYFLYKFSEKPLHFFGKIGGLLFLIGFIISLYLSIIRLFFNELLYNRPLLQLGIVLIIVGIQIVMTGIIAELVVYLSKKNNKS